MQYLKQFCCYFQAGNQRILHITIDDGSSYPSVVIGYEDCHKWLCVKYPDLQFEIAVKLFQVLYKQLLIDRDSCSDTVGYFYNVSPEQMYKNCQENQLNTDVFAGI